MRETTLTLTLWFGYFMALYLPLKTTAADLIETEIPLYKKQVETSIKQFEDMDRKRWSFKVVRYEDEEGDVTTSTEVYTPNEDKFKRWSLLELNGKTPTQKQIKKFIKKKVKASKKKDDDSANYSIRLRELIDIDSLNLTNENETHKTMSFDVYIEKLGDDAIGKLDGELTFSKHQQYIDSIQITNNSEFSPVFSASITDFKLVFKFKKMKNAILPVENSMDMKGSFAFFTEIDETSNERYSDYVYVEPKE
ncbi:hypothetical protein [Aliikangiella coralliicola]|uniref:Outer membrane lipoprotein-sorting protein n=1 Tax=Aliikangiella coralliicola TaxID=2592383 RepID=A0A545UC88_9GAMM|nr:hypothetical protein [Aliikangiella coralliicola]TQV87082.1 hypothetical protein FLL46_14855 [Aliikangiella coralliicola]